MRTTITRPPFLSILPCLPILLSVIPALAPPATSFQRRETLREVKELESKLRAPYADARRRAVTRLGVLGSREAFELVLEALADDLAEPADEAQLVLPAFEATLGSKVVQKELFGPRGLRSRDTLVRLRVAEAFGRMEGPIDGEDLVDRVDRREGEVARALLWSIERLAAAGRLEGDPTKLAKDLSALLSRRVGDPIRAAAIQAIVRLDPASILADDPDLARISGGESLGSLLLGRIHAGRAIGDLTGARHGVVAALAHEEPGLRAMAIRLVPEMEPTRDDLAALAARLETEPRVALRGRIVATLQGLTGLKHQDHAAAWAHAVSGLPDDWVGSIAAAAGRPSGSESGPERESAATLERLGPESDRLAVLVDFSGSLWNEREDGSCRKDLLDPEMDRLLDRIDPESRFLLVPFTGEPHPFSVEPLEASRRELSAAKRFFRKATMRGQGNLYAAAQVALSAPGIDRILVLTDGAPTGGHRWDVELMGELLLEQTRFRPVIFDFVLLDAPPRLQRAWASVAERTGGRTLCLRM
ncbi:hypothetical protein Poly30_18740 [Planctomycetes bacterium Poly30]|uniref:VWFA domain-containing protein n=1 Tax=Saltatorellus ferox TaxID=2528018 RepID=A0A518EQM8_9BACT|nr:hypothetical protein Poly30_18740 [Planctomycetes bacterium Poly30]